MHAPTARSAEAFDRAKKVLVGGVNSPVRSFASVRGTPRFVERAKGAHIFDLDGNRYLDLVGSWGPAIVGHAHQAVVEAVRNATDHGLSFGAPSETETELAELIVSSLPSIDMIRFVSSGTEAVMSAIRLARAATERRGIIKFAGCYHGHADPLLVEAGSGAATHGIPSSAGVPTDTTTNTYTARFNDADSVRDILEANKENIAAVIVEPIAGNMGMVCPNEDFLQRLRHLCEHHGALLIFDEVMTGFRVAWGGAQVTHSITPDITCLGKVIGGGMPVGAYAARKELMHLVSPLGPMYQAGTLSGNPVAMAAGLATIRLCAQAGFYDDLHTKASRLAEGLRQAGKKANLPIQSEAAGGMLGLAFSSTPVRNFTDARSANHDHYARFFHAMLERGVWLPPSGYEAWFLSSAHTDDDINEIIETARSAFASIA